MNPTTETLPPLTTFKKSRPMASNPHHKSPKPSPSLFSSSSSSPSCYSPSITQMDDDHIFTILHLLPLESILSFSMTCRRFRSLGSSASLWESICRRDWGSGMVDALLASSSQERSEISWKNLYQEVSHLGSLSCRRLLSKDGIFPKSRASHSFNFVSDSLVLFGGGCDGGRHLDDTWVAHIEGNAYNRVLTWQKVSSGIPNGRFGHSCTVISDDALILFGGINDNGVRQNDTWVGHVTSEPSSRDLHIQWHSLDVGPVSPPPRGAHADCSAGDRCLVIHGGIGLYGLRLSDTWLLDLSDNLRSARWHQIPNSRPSPSARSGHSMTWIGGTQMILFGGRGSGYEVFNDVWIFDLSGDRPKWTELKFDSSKITDMPLPRVGHSATFILGGKLLIYGGEDSQRHRKDDFWVLDISNLLMIEKMGSRKSSARGVWKRLKVEGCGPGHRSFHGACTDQSGRCVYVFGGMVDGAIQPGEAQGLRFDGGLYLVELVLRS